MTRMVLAVSLTAFGPLAVAGSGWTPIATAVPVDSPVALLGLAIAIALVGARVMRNRRK